MIFPRRVADRFLRRSGSRVSILKSRRREVPAGHLASVKSLYPLGQPKKALGHEPQIDLCVAIPATAAACQLQKPINIVLLNKDATEMDPCKTRGTTQPLVSSTGAGRQGNTFSFRSREKNVLDFCSYRSGFFNISNDVGAVKIY